MANKDKNTKQEHMQHNKQAGQGQHDESNMELGEHQSGHIQDQQQGQQSDKSGGTMTQTHTSDQRQMEGQHQRQPRKYQQGSKLSADEPAEGSRENVEDDLKRQNK